jgi:hypothetical protein
MDLMWWINRIAFLGIFPILYKGKLLEKGRSYNISASRCVMAVILCKTYLSVGDYMSSCILWNDAKYIYGKYEPIIKEERRKIYSDSYHDLEN